jgi:hypothetical protein
MFGSIRRRLAFVLAATLGLGMGAAPGIASQPALVQSAPRVTKSSKRGLFGGAIPSAARYGRKGACISMAQQRRTATKKRGIARNRRNHR